MPRNSSNPIKSYIASMFDIRGWADWDRLRGTSNYFLSVFRRLFIIRRVNPSEIKSFEEVLKEQGLTEETLQARAKGLKRLCIFMLIFTGCFYLYGMYELFYGGFLSVMLSLVLMFISLALSFRYHFWYYQIESRKLGCSLAEWFKATFMKGGDV